MMKKLLLFIICFLYVTIRPYNKEKCLQTDMGSLLNTHVSVDNEQSLIAQLTAALVLESGACKACLAWLDHAAEDSSLTHPDNYRLFHVLIDQVTNHGYADWV